MPAHLKPTPEKHCYFCDNKLERKRLPNGDLEYLIHFNRRKFCSRTCCGKAADAKHRGGQSWATVHHHARKLLPSGPCEVCGRANAKDVHHLDHNPQNNAITNLQRLCRSCHTKLHRPRKSCKVCGRPAKGLMLCEKHYQRFKKYGDPLLTKTNQHTPVGRSED